MNVTLPAHVEELIRRKVESGRYASEGAVVEEAIRLLEERDRFEALRAAVAIGKAEADRGEVIEWTSTSMAELMREADEEDRLGLPICDDVLP
jgi:putative addiction module CopG family antidote